MSTQTTKPKPIPEPEAPAATPDPAVDTAARPVAEKLARFMEYMDKELAR